MKKIIHLFCASLLLLVGCTENVALEVNPVSEPFFASVEGATRTYADENGKLLWTANDRITIFKGTTYPLVYQFTGSTGDNYGGFNDVTTSLGEFNTSNSLPTNYAIYPYAEGTTISNSGVINYTIPATQTYAENSFGVGANVMVAVTENKDDRNLEFKNVGGYFEFSLYGEGVTVRSIVFSGNNNEKLAGDVSITATHDGSPVIAFADDATTTLTLDCGEGVELGADAEHATKFWFVVPSITYEDGITITITDTEGNEMEKTTENRIIIERSTVQPLAAFKVETNVNTPPNNQIWYTSTYGDMVTPYKAPVFANYEDVFGANIVNNVYENGKGVITFDGNVTSIGYRAFYDRSSLTSITLPDSVTSIGEEAFYNCRSLSSITLPDSITSIGERAFSTCESLSSITLPDSVTSIGKEAFRYCKSFTSITIPDSVTSIGVWAFLDCYSLASFNGKYASSDKRCLIVDGVLKSFAPAGLTTYTIPSGVTAIGDWAFDFCKSLTSITIPNSVTSIGDGAFDFCKSLTSITIPNSVTSIGGYAFNCCSSLTSITIPSGVTSIGYRAFGHCKSLTSITLPDSVTTIGEDAFYYCSSLTSITIPDGVTSIGEYAFYYCLSLESITLPENVTSIGKLAFYDCSSLTTVYSKNPTPPTWSGYIYPFDDCANLKKIYVPTSSVSAYQSADGWSSYASIIEGYTF